MPNLPELLPTSALLLGEWRTWINPLWMVAVGAGVAMLVYFIFYFLLKLTFSKVAAIARTTAKEAFVQPIFWVLLIPGAFLLLLFTVIPYNTFGEDIKMVKDSGLTLILVLAVIQTVWTSSVSIADEIEGRTALTLLSKPVGRREFILGKFLGVLAPVFILFVVLGAVFLTSVSYKVVYDAKESSLPEPTSLQCAQEMAQIAPGLALAFMETVVLAAISVAISTRLPMLPNLLICAAVYALGHLVPQLVQSSVGGNPIVSFVGQLFAVLLPILDHFNISAAIATGAVVPPEYLAWAALYCIAYSALAMLLALILFEDRDLA